MPTDLSPLAVEEYRALRATIRERGSLRLFVAALTFVAWAPMSLLVPGLVPNPVLSLIPLLVLAAGFEVVFALHVGVERVGRYIQVYFESDAGDLPSWEHVAMAIGGNAGSGIDALFAILFLSGTLLNLVVGGLLAARATAAELAVLGVLHALFIGRVLSARRFAAAQRQRDLSLFAEQRARSTRRT